MDTKVFAYFLAVSKYRSFARAAHELGISPQGLNSSMRRLESELGVPLFNDMYGTGELTDYGELFLEYARQIDGSLRDMRRGFDVMLAHSRNVIKLGCSIGVLGYLGEHVIDEFNKASEDAQVLVNGEEPDVRCERSLSEGAYDLALLVNPASTEFVTVSLVEDYQFFWINTKNRLSEKAQIGLEDLDGQTIAMVDDEFKNTDLFIRLMEERGVHADVVFTGEMMRVYEYARSGQALGLTCRNHIEATSESLRTVGVPFKDLPWGVSLCYRRDHTLTESEARFVEHLRARRRVYA